MLNKLTHVYIKKIIYLIYIYSIWYKWQICLFYNFELGTSIFQQVYINNLIVKCSFYFHVYYSFPKASKCFYFNVSVSLQTYFEFLGNTKIIRITHIYQAVHSDKNNRFK